jgi:alcohol dehydrogenase class IV
MVQETYIGDNSINNLKDVVDRISPNSIFVVSGKRSYESCGAKKKIEELLSKYTLIRFYDFEENPKIEDVARGINLYNSNDCDLVIAIGGGSVIDMAKLIKSLSGVDDYNKAVINSSVWQTDTKLIAVPTTSGTGSEATHFAVVYLDKVKYSLAHTSILPDISILDAQFTYSLPKYLTAITGLDAFSQAIESLWSVNSTKESVLDSMKAIEIIWNNLENAVAGDNTARDRMSLASYLAGKAINVSKTTAPHAISYSFTSYNNIPHGHAVAITLPFFIEYNSAVNIDDCNDRRGVPYVKNMFRELFGIFSVNNGTEARFKVECFIRNLGIDIELGKLNLTSKDVDFALRNINFERLSNNPRLVSKDINLILS